jgi:hypothetical protein
LHCFTFPSRAFGLNSRTLYLLPPVAGGTNAAQRSRSAAGGEHREPRSGGSAGFGDAVTAPPLGSSSLPHFSVDSG